MQLAKEVFRVSVLSLVFGLTACNQRQNLEADSNLDTGPYAQQTLELANLVEWTPEYYSTAKLIAAGTIADLQVQSEQILNRDGSTTSRICVIASDQSAALLQKITLLRDAKRTPPPWDCPQQEPEYFSGLQVRGQSSEIGLILKQTYGAGACGDFAPASKHHAALAIELTEALRELRKNCK